MNIISFRSTEYELPDFTGKAVRIVFTMAPVKEGPIFWEDLKEYTIAFKLPQSESGFAEVMKKIADKAQEAW